MRRLRSKKRVVDPVLSVVIPFYRDDPSDILQHMSRLSGDDVEILAWDDGTDDPHLTQRLSILVDTLDGDVTIFVAAENKGRASARNALVDAARGDWILFLDADMQPADDTFLQSYLDAIQSGRGDVFFGGFIVEPNGSRDTALHRALSHVSDCADAATRALHGPQHVASSNLCVRGDVIEAENFDTGFLGWGWEDSEWAARVARRYRVLHLDNPAIHLGLESDDTLLDRFSHSGANYRRFADAHPDFVQGLPLYRHAMRLKSIPGQRATRPILKALAKSPLPMRLRILALKLWRASHYAEAI